MEGLYNLRRKAQIFMSKKQSLMRLDTVFWSSQVIYFGWTWTALEFGSLLLALHL